MKSTQRGNTRRAQRNTREEKWPNAGFRRNRAARRRRKRKKEVDAAGIEPPPVRVQTGDIKHFKREQGRMATN